MTQPSAYVIVQAHHQAWTSGEVERAVADDIVRRSPGEDLTGKAADRRPAGT